MAFKVSSSRLIKAAKLSRRAHDAINNLERASSNKILYPQLKKDLDEFARMLESTYDLKDFDEWKSTPG